MEGENLTPKSETRPEAKESFDTKIKALFAGGDPAVDKWNVSQGRPTELQDINGFSEFEPERKKITDVLKNPSVPPSLRIQLGKYIAGSRVSPHSIDMVMESYEIFGEEVGEEVKNKIFPLMLAGLAYDKYDTYKEDLIGLYEEKPISDNPESEKKRSILSRVKDRFNRQPKIVSEESPDRRIVVERKVESMRNLVLKLYPTLSSDDPIMLGRWERIGRYTGVSDSRGDAGYYVSEDLSKLPAETLEKYIEDLDLLTDLTEYENLSRSVASIKLSEGENGIRAPFVALGRSAKGYTMENDYVPIDSVLH